jgi:hypothetical protein
MRRALPAFVVFAFALALVRPPVARGDAPPELPGPAPRARAEGYDVAAENARCEGCHEDVAEAWRGSLHRLAWVDPVFAAAYVIEPLPFCRGCHAPESDPRKTPTQAARDVGVGCVTCHVEGGEIIGVRAVSAHGPGTHAVRADPRLATDEACASCHEFEFPSRRGALMQGTVSEHRESRHAGMSCQTCHMKPEANAKGVVRRGHGFSASKDPALLRSALAASAARKTERSIAVTLRATGAGHAFPTGDMFRRLEVRAFAQGDDDKPMKSAPPVILERVFRAAPMAGGGVDRVEVRDDRVPASGAPRDVVVLFPEPIEGQKVAWEVVYRRMGPAMAAAFGVDMKSDEVVVARGILK